MNKIRTQKLSPVNIVGDGLVSTVTRGEGRFIPALILDTSQRPDIDELLRVHQHYPPGDAASTWASVPLSKASIALNLRFIKPIECEFAISFIPEAHAILIDGILHAQGLHFMAGCPGDNLSTTMDNPKIMVEVPRLGFAAVWEKRMPKIVSERFRAQGLSRQEARRAAGEFIRSTREILTMRRE